MKNKASTYILLVAVIGIWGTIIYKIIDGLSQDDEIKIELNEELSFKQPEQKKIDSFSLLPINRDPFLDKPVLATSDKQGQNKAKKSVEINIPLIYHGLIKNSDSKQRLFMVSINGQQTFMKKGQEIQGVKLLYGNEKKIIVSYQKVKKTIEKG